VLELGSTVTDNSSTFSKRQTEETVLPTSTAMVVKAPVCPPNYFTCLTNRSNGDATFWSKNTSVYDLETRLDSTHYTCKPCSWNWWATVD